MLPYRPASGLGQSAASPRNSSFAGNQSSGSSLAEGRAGTRQSLVGLDVGLLAWAPPGPAGPGAAAVGLAELSPGVGQVALGPLGPLPQLGAGFLQDPGAVLERCAQFFPLAGGVGADPGGLGPGILGLGPGRGRALPGLVTGFLGGPDEVLGLGPGLAGFLLCLPDLAVGADLRLGDRLVPLGLGGADLAGGGLADPLGFGPGQRGLLEGLGGSLLGLLAGGFGGLQLLVHLRRRGAGLLGVGLGLLAALRLAGQAAAGVSDLRDRLGLHRLDLRLGRLRIRGSLQLLGGRGELGY
jgi:hypothetical protein